MKIVYVVEDYSVNGGVERIVTDKANYFSATAGYDVTIVTVYEDSREPRYQLNAGVKLVRLGVPMARKSDKRFRQAAFRASTLLCAAKRLNRTVWRIKPDVIFFTTTLGALLVPLVFTRAKKIFESHSARRFTPYHKYFWLTERTADCVVCLTEGDADEWLIAKNVKVIPNFLEKQPLTVKDYSVKRAVAAGRLEYVKGFDILINSWNKAIKEDPEWKLDIWGEGSCREALQQQIDSLGLSDSITLCGRSDDMMSVYANYSLHLMTSRFEGLPMVLIEAQASGLPSVAFDFIHGARDVINEYISGLLVTQLNDPIAFAATVMRMMRSENLRRRLGTAALRTNERFSKDQVFDRWITLIGG